MEKFKGLGVAMVTPFNADGSIDYLGLERLTNHLVDGGVNYLVVMGTTGENPTINNEEQQAILQKVIEINARRLPIVFGIGGNSTAAVVERLKSENLEGVDGILCVSPYYNKPSQEGIYQHYKAVSDATPLPVIMYNVPGRTGSLVSAETTLRIAQLPNIVCTKEASGSLDICMDVIRGAPEDFGVISGDDNYTMPYIAAGMQGVISVLGNAYPKEFSQMVNYALDGDFKNAKHLHYKLLPLMKAIFMDGNPGGVKYALNKLGICQDEFRLPVVPVNKTTEKSLDEAML
ncbi:4-hydroxy-tetrahydrodipicolinate synthase [Bacteroidia bacterium]|nr:4-hydroxy-tetrahydrodipicolinate synthase [Bacteroidia bacterium]|tara:strand:- start:560 stop:1426 length:867 start_codon:yes stop_codon:yes gene_type:complete